jgi:hypothetical protein
VRKRRFLKKWAKLHRFLQHIRKWNAPKWQTGAAEEPDWGVEDEISQGMGIRRRVKMLKIPGQI